MKPLNMGCFVVHLYNETQIFEKKIAIIFTCYRDSSKGRLKYLVLSRLGRLKNFL